MKPLRSKASRLITLLETVTGTTAPERNKLTTLLFELVRQRDMYRRERNAANAEVIRTRRRMRRQMRVDDEHYNALAETVNAYGDKCDAWVELLERLTGTTAPETDKIGTLIRRLAQQRDDAQTIRGNLSTESEDTGP